MKVTKRQLKRIIKEEYRKIIREYGPPGIGGQGNYGLGSEKQLPKGMAISDRGLGWTDFQEMAQSGDYDGAGEWLRDLFRDYGITGMPMEFEHELIRFGANPDVSTQELQMEFDAMVDMMR